jgi:hypothetical protein
MLQCMKGRTRSVSAIEITVSKLISTSNSLSVYEATLIDYTISYHKPISNLVF